MKTNFEKVQEFNRAFDMVPPLPASYTCPKNYEHDDSTTVANYPFTFVRLATLQDKPLLKLRLDLIAEEINELNVAIKDNNTIEIRDALADILYVVFGMADVLGIDLDNYFTDHIKHYYILAMRQPPSTPERPATQFDYIKVITPSALDNNRSKDATLEGNLYGIHMHQTNLTNYCNEFKKVMPNISTFDFHYIAFCLYELTKCVYRYAYISGFDADADFAIVHNSNMSKLCDSEDDAKLTVTDYVNKFNAGTSPYDSPYYYELPTLGKWIVKNKSTGKALKNIKYCKVQFP